MRYSIWRYTQFHRFISQKANSPSYSTIWRGRTSQGDQSRLKSSIKFDCFGLGHFWISSVRDIILLIVY
jgi:hypothetical protein